MARVEPVSFDRSGFPEGPTGPVLRPDEVAAWENGYRFLAEAEKQLAETQERAKQEASVIHADAHARGYEEGKAAGVAEATRLVAETAIKVDRYLGSVEHQIATLAMDIVRRVLGEFDVMQLVAAAASQAVADLRRENALRVTVHPEAVERVRAALARDPAHHHDVTVEANPALDKAACIVASDCAVIDAGIETQLQAIRAAFDAAQRDDAS